ncbi:MAG: (d)CMP kinase [Puniceicoccales bacterium]|nr:(d)CMP kinase [Puniceicoccales bacterium]
MKAFPIIAIDGAAASGKTTTTKMLADKYGLMRVSTGEHYRAITYQLLSMDVNPNDEGAVANSLKNIEIGNAIIGNHCTITISGAKIDDNLLRSAEINERVSQFAHIPSVRKFLFNYQRSQSEVSRKHGFWGLAIEGRDMTSVVFPDADLRFFLHADADKRERRRNCGIKMDPIAKRDSADAYVTICQDGVIRIDTGLYDLESVICIISKYVEDL